MKVAIVTDYLLQLGGAEKVTSAIASMYPDADIYTLICDDKVKEKHFKGREIIEHPAFKDSWFKRKFYRLFVPMYPTYIEDFDFSGYDLIISSSYLWAKGILPDMEATHVSYVHTPIRQAWVKYHEYLHNENDIGRIKRFFLRFVMNYIRMWDVSSSKRVDHFIANSTTVKKRIEHIYRREASVIHPPIEISEHSKHVKSRFGDYYVTLGRLVPYKRIDLLIEAFNQCPTRKLYIMGDGNDMERLKELTQSPNIHFMGYVDDETKYRVLSHAKGFLFAAEEDFGMSPIEAMATGVPVLGYNKGGTRDYIQDGINGTFFEEQNSRSLLKALDRFENMNFSKEEIVGSVKKFSEARFKYQFTEFMEDKVKTTKETPQSLTREPSYANVHRLH
ncbi:glycosyltransferase [Aliifodinibius sp. S!AR15-10]|uniref:glycosyltransferase n=1 Tax=Aliifodinibius sp. S!AR15-10 TaxID=2950437 RepID=UPI002863031C|nr:glycosyltransferase [Aliifodinibius sp. S!AR15-10]MDR8394279.1 glycosyltransferase [Aliifodinibius sp. S!AR15-10]